MIYICVCVCVCVCVFVLSCSVVSDYLVNKLKIKKFTLYIHPYIAAYVNQGFMSMKRKWQMKYGFGIKIVPDQSLAFLQYKFTDDKKEEIDMKEEIEIK